MTAGFAALAAHLALVGDAFGEGWACSVFIALVAVLVVARHRSNIQRLRAGTEAKIGHGSKDRDEEGQDGET